MKKLNFWSTLMLVVMAFPLLVSCSGDDSNDGGGSSVSYTEAEIVELLTGKWEVYGDLKYEAYNTQEVFTDKYKGTLEFTAAKSVKFVLTEGNPLEYEVEDGRTYSLYFEEIIIDDYHKYSVLKKGGRSYIAFGSKERPSEFEIVSLTKNTFLLRCDQDWIIDKGTNEPLIHIYMTIKSN